KQLPPPTIAERVDMCRTHLVKSLEWKKGRVGIFEMRRHYSNYFKGLDHFRDYRTRLVTTESEEELHSILDEVRERYEPSVS
ncbi:MAG: tRNA dihydrouridine synthase DusB, partial [Bacteroidota bacterium]